MATIVMAVAANGVIGDSNASNGLPWPRLEGDLQNLYKTAEGMSLIVGRKTLGMIPPTSPLLKNALSIHVLTSNLDGISLPEGVRVQVHPSMEDALAQADPNAVVIGGEQVYRATLRARVSWAVITQIRKEYPGDTKLPWPPVEQDVYGRWEERIDERQSFPAEAGTPAYTITHWQRIDTDSVAL